MSCDGGALPLLPFDGPAEEPDVLRWELGICEVGRVCTGWV